MKSIPVIVFGLTILTLVVSAQQIEIKDIKANADPELVDIVNTEAIPINQLDSDDFSDLQFLKKELEGKRIIYLGESNHHAESYNTLKFRLVRFLNSEMNFNVIAFESSISSCGHSNLLKDSLNSFYILTHSLLGGWRTPVVADMIQFLKDHAMGLSGFDPNLNSLMLDKKYYSALIPYEGALAVSLFNADSALQTFQQQRFDYFGKKETNEFTEKELDETGDKIKKQYALIKLKIRQHSSLNEDKTQLLVCKFIDNKLHLLNCSNRQKASDDEKVITSENRERLMADNLAFLVDTLYDDQKIIVWGHNTHISKGGKSTKTDYKNSFLNNSVGYQLSKRHSADSYHIAFFGFPGIIGNGYSKNLSYLLEAKKNSLEAIMYNSKSEISFLKLSKEKLPFLNKPIINFTELNYTDSSILPDCYDALIFVKHLKPAILIRYDEREYYQMKYESIK